MNQLAFFPTGRETASPTMMVRDLPMDCRPAYRIEHVGPSALSDVELLQLVGRFPSLDTPHQLLAQSEGLAGLGRLSAAELSTLSGVGPASAAAIQAALELGRRSMAATDDEPPQIRTPHEAAAILLPQMADLEQEHLVTLILNTRNRLLKLHTVYVGSLNTSLVRVGEIFREAIRRNAAAILVAHNHPSGDPSPSPEDVAITRNIVHAGQLVDIDVLDHLVVGRARWVSLKERGLGF